jgi:hypothetical protein
VTIAKEEEDDILLLAAAKKEGRKTTSKKEYRPQFYFYKADMIPRAASPLQKILLAMRSYYIKCNSAYRMNRY